LSLPEHTGKAYARHKSKICRKEKGHRVWKKEAIANSGLLGKTYKNTRREELATGVINNCEISRLQPINVTVDGPLKVLGRRGTGPLEGMQIKVLKKKRVTLLKDGILKN